LASSVVALPYAIGAAAGSFEAGVIITNAWFLTGFATGLRTYFTNSITTAGLTRSVVTLPGAIGAAARSFEAYVVVTNAWFGGRVAAEFPCVHFAGGTVRRRRGIGTIGRSINGRIS